MHIYPIFNLGFYNLTSVFYVLFIGILIQSCELPPPREIYNPEFSLNQMEQFPLGWTYERGLPISIRKIPGPDGKSFKPELTAEIENPVILSQKVLVKDSGSYFVIGKFRATIENGSFFISATGESFNEQVEFKTDVNSCNRTFFSFQVNDRETVTLRIGFTKNSIGIAYPDTLFFYKEKYFYPVSIDARAMRAGLEQFAGIGEMSEKTIDSNIDKIANILNVMYLSSDQDSTSKLTEFFGSVDFNVEQTKYLYDYIKNWEGENNAYDQKISLTIDELLKLYRIPVRQLYLRSECKSKHQFVEYFNQFKSEWSIIDAFYGIRYVDEEGKYLGMEDVDNLVRNGSFSNANIRKLDIRAFKYSEEEIMEKWASLEPSTWIIRK